MIENVFKVAKCTKWRLNLNFISYFSKVVYDINWLSHVVVMYVYAVDIHMHTTILSSLNFNITEWLCVFIVLIFLYCYTLYRLKKTKIKKHAWSFITLSLRNISMIYSNKILIKQKNINKYILQQKRLLNCDYLTHFFTRKCA